MAQLTVIVPFYNETAFLRTALISIFDQRLPDLEVVIVNDNPEQFSPSDLETLSQGFDVTILHHPKNLGLSAARNTGLRAAKGAWIGFLDADDYYTTRGLSEHFAYAKHVNADIVHAPCNVSPIGVPDAAMLPRNAKLHQKRGVHAGLTHTPEAQFIVSSWSSLYRRDFLTRNDLWFDEEQTKFEDRLFVIHAVTAAQSIAYFDKAVRVWRKRTGSITTSHVTRDIHVLQLQLLEKCLAHIRHEIVENRLPPIYEKRELFNTVSRLIWDTTLIQEIADAPDDPELQHLGTRIQTLLGTDSFGHQAFSDAMIQNISRVGMKTRLGLIKRVDFLEIHRLMRAGDFQEAVARLRSCQAPPPAPFVTPPKLKGTRLILHVGLHKTGSTYIQHHLLTHRAALAARGVLVPKTGIQTVSDNFNMRDGGLPGFQGLVSATRDSNAAVWHKLYNEIKGSGLKTVVISAENMLFPLSETRDNSLNQLWAALSGFDTVDVVAMARHPVAQLESFYKEWVSNGIRSAARSIEEFYVDHADSFSDMAYLFTPFEQALNTTVKIGNFDHLKKGDLWQGFCALAGLPDDIPSVDAPRYPSADRESIQLLQLMCMMIPTLDQRRDILRSYFSTYGHPQSSQSLMSPELRLAFLDLWQERSQEFAAARGYAPDLAKLRQDIQAEDWAPLGHIDMEQIQTLLTCAAQSIPDAAQPHKPAPPRPKRVTSDASAPSITIRAKPWMAKLIRTVIRSG